MVELKHDRLVQPLKKQISCLQTHLTPRAEGNRRIQTKKNSSNAHTPRDATKETPQKRQKTCTTSSTRSKASLAAQTLQPNTEKNHRSETPLHSTLTVSTRSSLTEQKPTDFSQDNLPQTINNFRYAVQASTRRQTGGTISQETQNTINRPTPPPQATQLQ